MSGGLGGGGSPPSGGFDVATAANLSAQFLSAVSAFKDSDKKASVASRFSGNHMTDATREHFAVRAGHSSLSIPDLAQYVLLKNFV